MKKLLAAATAVIGIISASAGFALAADSIDFAGKAAVAIASPSTPITHAAGRQVTLDSAGYLTAATPRTVKVPQVTALDLSSLSHACLDSSCKTELKM